MKVQTQKEITTDTPHQSGNTFASSAIEIWKALNWEAAAQAYPAGTELFRQGTAVQTVYLIEHGIVKLTRLEPDGREISVGLRFPGWIIGAAAVIVQRSHLLNGRTLSECRLRHVPSEVFLHLLHTNAQFSWLVHQMHSQEVFDQSARVAQLEGTPARHRFEQLLWQLLAVSAPGGLKKETKIALPLKQWEIAGLIPVTPSYLSRMYNELEQEGILHRRNGWLIIHDPQRLWHWDDC